MKIESRSESSLLLRMTLFGRRPPTVSVVSALLRINVRSWPNRNNLQRRSDNHKDCTYNGAEANLLRDDELSCKDRQIETDENADPGKHHSENENPLHRLVTMLAVLSLGGKSSTAMARPQCSRQ